MLYEEGVRRAQQFAKDYYGQLEYKLEFGDHSLPDKESKDDDFTP